MPRHAAQQSVIEVNPLSTLAVSMVLRVVPASFRVAPSCLRKPCASHASDGWYGGGGGWRPGLWRCGSIWISIPIHIIMTCLPILYSESRERDLDRCHV